MWALKGMGIKAVIAPGRVAGPWERTTPVSNRTPYGWSVLRNVTRVAISPSDSPRIVPMAAIAVPVLDVQLSQCDRLRNAGGRTRP